MCSFLQAISGKIMDITSKTNQKGIKFSLQGYCCHQRCLCNYKRPRLMREVCAIECDHVAPPLLVEQRFSLSDVGTHLLLLALLGAWFICSTRADVPPLPYPVFRRLPDIYIVTSCRPLVVCGGGSSWLPSKAPKCIVNTVTRTRYSSQAEASPSSGTSPTWLLHQGNARSFQLAIQCSRSRVNGEQLEDVQTGAMSVYLSARKRDLL